MCFFFNDTATTEIYTLSLHDALPISKAARASRTGGSAVARSAGVSRTIFPSGPTFRSTQVVASRSPLDTFARSEEHTSELQSRQYLVCRLLLEKKNKKRATPV